MRNLGTSGSRLQKHSRVVWVIAGCLVASAVGAHGPYVSMTRTADGAVFVALTDAESGEELILSEGIASGTEATAGPGRVGGFEVVHESGHWFAFGGELACGRHASIWSWGPDPVGWSLVAAGGTPPDPRHEHVVWSEGDEVVWCSVGNPLVLHRFHRVDQRWYDEGERVHLTDEPSNQVIPLEDYVVWSTDDQELNILRKSDLALARFPNDAWAGYLVEAVGARHLRTSSGNVLEFGPDEQRIARYDFSEKVRFADFAVPTARGLSVASPELGSDHLGLPWLLLLGSWCAFAGFTWFQWSRSRTKQAAHFRDAASEVNVDAVPAGPDSPVRFDAISHWSEPLRVLVLSNQRSYASHELDELWDLHFIASPETLRAKRSRLIHGVNTEFNLLYGYDLIRRKRDENDRRKVTYYLAALPPHLAKSLQRNGVHQLHADDGSNGANSVAENSQQDTDRS